MTYIFLDEFVWIDIRKNLLLEKNCKDYLDVINLINQKVKNNQWVFPISAEHIAETRNTGDDVKRLTTSKFMGTISRGYTIQHFSLLKSFEISKLLSDKNPVHYTNEVIIKDINNIWNQTGTSIIDNLLEEKRLVHDDKIKLLLSQVYEALNNNGDMLMSTMNTSNILSSADAQIFIDSLESARSSDLANPYVSEVHFMLDMLEQYYSNEQCIQILQYCKIHCKKKGDLKKTFKNLPTYYTNCMLIFKCIRSQHSQKPFHKNDFTDMLYLSYMIPYCDVVVTEKKWVNLAKQAKLDTDFNTILLSDLNELKHIQNS